jgi:hypothetical protein
MHFCMGFFEDEVFMEQPVRKLDAANSSSGSWDATRTQSQDNNLYVVRPILPTSTEHTRYITISL